MSLAAYRKKRDFSASSEPKGRAARGRSGDLFVVQKHAARRLHYDFRLEMNGVLKSWAVTRGPSLDPHDKRLAVHVEDHPLEYGGFEGTIPKGEYGGGTVVLWDRGRWTPLGDAAKGYAKGHLEFDLAGEKMKGRWHLVRMAPRRGETRDNWLLIKGDDAEASADVDLLAERPESVKTGRGLDEIAAEAPGWSSKKGGPLKPTPPEPTAPNATSKSRRRGSKAALADLPDFVPPVLATPVKTPPKGRRWIHEVKFDGYRIMARLENGAVRLLTRTGLDWTARFGRDVPAALARLPAAAALLDGEIVVENAQGASDFGALQADLSEGRKDRFRYYVFDVLHLDGRDLTREPLSRRRVALDELLADAEPPLALSGQFAEDGALILKHACRLSLEGVVSKLKTAPYRPGRTGDWAKSKCARRQEFVIGGYVPSTTERGAIGSLILGLNEKGTLAHVGRVGTGFTTTVARDLFKRLQPLRRDASPFGAKLTAEEARRAVFVAPNLVAEVEYRAWTADHHLRHASFRGLREDKSAAEVVREDGNGGEQALRPRVALTHPDRIYWPDAGVTKEGLAGYYADVWRFMAPFVVDRPLSLVRCPGGTTQQCFFQKHAWKGVNKAIRQVPDPAAPREEPLLVIDDLDGVAALVQGGALEIHPWGATLAALEQPDMLIFDLDPGEGVGWDAVIAAAVEVRERLTAQGLGSFVKTSGGKGLHVVASLKPSADWAAAKAFSKGLAAAMVADAPDRFVAVVTKSKRRGKILVDYLRNGRGATAVCAYSSRARAGAPVSMPLDWSELGPHVGPAHFTVGNAAGRLAGLAADPWADFRRAARPLEVTSGGRRKRT